MAEGCREAMGESSSSVKKSNSPASERLSMASLVQLAQLVQSTEMATAAALPERAVPRAILWAGGEDIKDTSLLAFWNSAEVKDNWWGGAQRVSLPAELPEGFWQLSSVFMSALIL